MILKRSMKKVSSDSWTTFREAVFKMIDEMLGEAGVTEKGYLVDQRFDVMKTVPESVPKGIINPNKFGNYSMSMDVGGNFDNYCRVSEIMWFRLDGIVYYFMVSETDYARDGYSFISECIDNPNKGDYFDINNLGYRNGKVSDYEIRNGAIFSTDVRWVISICRDVSNKLFHFGIKIILPSGNVKSCGGGHCLVNNLSTPSNDGYLTFLPKPIMTSKKDFNTREEAFRFINPISFYGSESFNLEDNIDKVNGKAYIQKPLIAMYRHGIVGELKGVYYSTIKAPAIFDVVSLGGITYVYLGGGMYFKNV